MLNIANDDAVPLKYLWRNSYENLSLTLWYELTRQDGVFFDVGAHTGIYSIIGNLNNTYNNIISIEPYFLNFSRLLSNLKINSISHKSCLMAAASNEKAITAFAVENEQSYHSSSGSISDVGILNVPKIKIDNFNFDKKIYGIKIDTEGHEFEVLQGGINSIKKDKPDIIFEINKYGFNNCLDILKTNGYEYFYFINEAEQRFMPIKEFSPSLIKPEGSNCYATTNTRFI
jgi:FkbM family methyltransferase